MSNAANSFDPRQAIEGLIGFAKEKATGAVKSQFKAKPDAQKVETAILAALESGAKTAAQIVKSIHLTSGGTWAPTDGEANQALAKLAESNHVSAATEEDRKVYSLTQQGTDALAAARVVCNQPGTCRVLGWADPAAIPQAFPIPPSARAALQFSYSRDPSGTEIALYGCGHFAGIPREQCIPRAR